MTSYREMLQALGAFKIVEPAVDYAFGIALEKRYIEAEGDAPHGRPWHVSFHASSFPGDSVACPRMAMYGLMDIPNGGPMSRWLQGVVDVGKAVELTTVRAVRDAGMLARSNQPGRSSDPDAKDENGNEAPQMGFVEEDTWLTGSVDMPIVPIGYDSTHIGEIKSKHEEQIREMQRGERSYDEKHRKQVLASLGLAHDHGADAFLHPTEDRILGQAIDGSLYYVSRDTGWPGFGAAPLATHEFYFEHNPGFMEEGRAQLRSFRQSFLEGELPQRVERKNARSHPMGWKWSEGLCKFCPLKKICKTDYEQGVTKIADSTSIGVATFTRPGYDPALKRKAVFDQWNLSDPLVP